MSESAFVLLAGAVVLLGLLAFLYRLIMRPSEDTSAQTYDPDGPVVLTVSSMEAEAEMYRSILEGEGVVAFVRNPMKVQWQTQPLHGWEVLVRNRDLEAARNILDLNAEDATDT